MGSGGFGTNASMHWKVSHSDRAGDPPTSSGRDPISVDLIGEGSNPTGGSKGHRGFLRVRLRFVGPDAERKLTELMAYLQANKPSDNYQLQIDVPIIPRTQNEIEQGLKDPWEVRVDW